MPKRCRHLWTNGGFSRTYGWFSRTYGWFSRTYGWFFLKVPSNLKKHKKTWWLPMPLLLFIVRGIEHPPSATILQTSSSYLVRASSLFLPSLLSLILQAAVDAVSHFSHHPLACRQSANCSFFH